MSNLWEDTCKEKANFSQPLKSQTSDLLIVGGGFTKEKFDQRCQEIKDQIEIEPSKHLKKVHQERLARM